jgi:hypothetical protein
MGKPYLEIGKYGGVGLEFVLTIFIVAGIGHYLDDRYWNHGTWGMSVGFVLGVAVAFRNLMRTASKMQRDIERAEARDPEAGRWKVDESWVHRDPPDSAQRLRDRGDHGPS